MRARIAIGAAVAGLTGWWAWHRYKVAKGYGLPAIYVFSHPFTDVARLWQEHRALEMKQGL